MFFRFDFYVSLDLEIKTKGNFPGLNCLISLLIRLDAYIFQIDSYICEHINIKHRLFKSCYRQEFCIYHVHEFSFIC